MTAIKHHPHLERSLLPQPFWHPPSHEVQVALLCPWCIAIPPMSRFRGINLVFLYLLSSFISISFRLPSRANLAYYQTSQPNPRQVSIWMAVAHTALLSQCSLKLFCRVRHSHRFCFINRYRIHHPLLRIQEGLAWC